jgi:putative phosphoesterase
LALRIGLISDTHGLLRPEALAFLAGADHIIHGGDIGGPEILDRLREIAPLTVVRGNNDTAPWAKSIPETAPIDFGGVGILVIHDLKELGIDPAAHGVRVVVSGHSHKPACVERGGVLYVNPGSAGRRRFTLPIAAGELLIDGGRVDARLVTLLP